MTSAYRGVRVMVLGASGFIGRWLSRALAAEGASLHLVVRDGSALGGERGDADVSVADLSRSDAITDVVARARPSVVFNLAGYGVDPTEREPSTAAALNGAMPARLAEAIATHGDRTWAGQQVVHVGSALEYGTAGGDLAESTVATPTTLYGITKLDGTTQLHAAAVRLGVRAVTARLFTVYGAGEHAGRLLPSLVAAAKTAAPIPLTSGLQQRDFTYVDDVVSGLLRLGLLADADQGPVNVATSRLTTVRKFVETAATVLGIAHERLVFGALPTRTEEMHHEPVSIARLRALTGWVPETTIARGLERVRDHLGA